MSWEKSVLIAPQASLNVRMPPTWDILLFTASMEGGASSLLGE
jgi:hypothetical protein